MKATVLGAGATGAATSQRLSECDVFETVVLADTVAGRAEGLALDLNQSQRIVGSDTRLVGQRVSPDGSGYDATTESDIVVIAAGQGRAAGLGREALVASNREIVSNAVRRLIEESPECVILIVTSPVPEMALTACRASQFVPERIVGVSGMLDAARFACFVAERLNVSAGAVDVPVLGSHGEELVPIISACTVEGRRLDELLDDAELVEIVHRTRAGGTEITGLLGGLSPCYGPSAATAQIARAVAEDSGQVLTVCAWLDGEYGISQVYMGVEAEICRRGVNRVVERQVTDTERARLTDVARAMGRRQAEVDRE